MATPPTHRRRRRAGFTLLELLVALALLAALTVILMSALEFGTQVWRRDDGAAADLAVAYRTLQNNLERALPIPEQVEQSNAIVMAFDGTQDALTLVVANPGRVGLLGDTVLRLEGRGGAGNGAPFLALSWAPYDPQHRLAIDTFNETLTLLPDVRAVSFRYFGTRDGGGEPPRWSDTWRAQTRLPRIIAIDLETADGRQRTWSFRLRDSG